MLIWFSWFLVDFINNLVFTNLFKKINNINYSLRKMDYIILIIVSILTSTIIVSFPSIIRYMLKIFIMIFIYRNIFKESFAKTIISVFILYVGIIAAEAIFIIVFLLLLRMDKTFLEGSALGIIITNLFISIIVYSLFRMKWIKKLTSLIIKWYSNNDTVNVVLTCSLAELVIGILEYQNYEINFTVNYLIVYIIFIFGSIIFIIGFFKEKIRNNKLIYDYDQLLEYSKEYEKEVVEKSKKQHEHRNQLVIIKSMISSKDKETIKYIDDLLKEPSGNKDFKLINKLSYIHSNGLKGLIYYKIKEMRKKKINVSVEISEQINDKKLWKICDLNLKDISRCLGVYIDNAIEATSISNEKEFMLEIIKDDNNIVFIISNTFTGELDLSKFDKEGYSSKGKNRGYGLPLVKEIIDNNEFIFQEREIIREYFIQKLYIKTNKK